jgi:hypothetical protein
VDVTRIEPAAFPISSGRTPFSGVEWRSRKIGGRDRDRTCGLIHAMDALSQLSYTPVTQQDELRMVWQTANILTNLPMKFHSDEHLAAGSLKLFLP